MPPQIVHLVQRFRPELEGTSKEVDVLHKHFQSFVHDLHFGGVRSFKLQRGLLSYHFGFYPCIALFLYWGTRQKIIHIYTTLRDRPYLPLFYRRKTILTSTNHFTVERLRPWKKYLQNVQKIVIESELQMPVLLQLGLQREKIELIYPPVDLAKFSYQKATGQFKILNASCPSRVSDLEKRGINLLMDADPDLRDCSINVLWRIGEFGRFQQMVNKRKFQSLHIERHVAKDMNAVYAAHHCTIIPYTRFDELLKLIPNSAIESLAAGKPVLVSSKTGIADLVRKEQCGIVFEPTKKSLLQAIQQVRENYEKYQKNCRPVAEKYFAQDLFLKKYQELYVSLGMQKK